MKKKLEHINDFFNEISDIKFIFVMLILSYVALIPLIPLFEVLDNSFGTFDKESYFLKRSALYNFISVVIIAPFVETLIFQHILIRLLQFSDNVKKNKSFPIFISALAFGLIHYYDVSYIFFAFSIGIILSYSYVLYQTKKTKLTAFKVVFLIHFFRNFISWLLIRGFIFT